MGLEFLAGQLVPAFASAFAPALSWAVVPGRSMAGGLDASAPDRDILAGAAEAP
jgi:hypothetical protein